MTRVLRRPMFRLGGPANEGITSGLAPRQGYKGTNDASDQRVMSDWLKNATLGDIKKFAQESRYRPRGVTPADSLIEFGLNIASAEPSGSILSTAAKEAKEPFQRYSKSKSESEAAGYVSEADMFKTLIGAQADIMGGEGAGKGWLEQWKFKQIPILNEKIDRLTKLNPKPGSEEFRELQNAKEQKARIVQLDPLTEGWARSDNAAMAIQTEAEKILREDRQKPEEERKYPPASTESSVEVVIDAIKNVRQRLQSGLNEGGRVGYATAGSVMGQGMPTQMPTTEDTMPEELGDVSYEELRARLPQEVSNEVVRLLANSPEALEDFATIQTEQDIANFNKKYGVNLVLPAEG